jgi:hypothetical protein
MDIQKIFNYIGEIIGEYPKFLKCEYDSVNQTLSIIGEERLSNCEIFNYFNILNDTTNEQKYNDDYNDDNDDDYDECPKSKNKWKKRRLKIKISKHKKINKYK